MGREQRWAASGVVVLLGALWLGVGGGALVEAFTGPQGDDLTGLYVAGVGLAIVGCAVVWLVGGLVVVSRVAAGRWHWTPVATCGGAAALLSALAVVPTWSWEVAWFTVLLAFQAVGLAAWVALLWAPVPVATTPEDAA